MSLLIISTHSNSNTNSEFISDDSVLWLRCRAKNAMNRAMLFNAKPLTNRSISGTSSRCLQSCQVLRRLISFSDRVPNISKCTRIILVCSYKRSYKPFHEKHDEADSSIFSPENFYSRQSMWPSWPSSTIAWLSCLVYGESLGIPVP